MQGSKIKLSEMRTGDIAYDHISGEIVKLNHHEQGFNSYDYLATVCNIRDRITFYRDYPDIDIDTVPTLIHDISLF